MHELLSSIRKFFSLFLFSNIDACLLYSSRINDTFHENLRKYISWKSVIRVEDFVDVISNQQRENWWSPGGGWWTVILFTNRVSPGRKKIFISAVSRRDLFRRETSEERNRPFVIVRSHGWIFHSSNIFSSKGGGYRDSWGAVHTLIDHN